MDSIASDLWQVFRSNPREETFRPFYDRTRALVYTLCRRILRDEDDALDAFQATFARLLILARDEKPSADAPDAASVVIRLAVREADNLRKRRSRRLEGRRRWTT